MRETSRLPIEEILKRFKNYDNDAGIFFINYFEQEMTASIKKLDRKNRKDAKNVVIIQIMQLLHRFKWRDMY